MKIKENNFDILQDNMSEHFKKHEELLDLLGVNRQWQKTKGKGIKVAIIDTGIDLNHPDLKKNIKKTYNALGGKTVQDGQGHGTHVAGIVGANGRIKGVAPEADLYIAKALNDKGEGNLGALIKAINWAIDENVHIISMSLGSQQGSPRLKEALDRAQENDIICICAAGNDQKGDTKSISIDYPAIYDNNIAVGAIERDFNITDFSSIGNVDVVTFGLNILSTYNNGKYAYLSGTSMAQPFMAGSATLMVAHSLNIRGKRLSLDEMRMLFAMESYDLGEKGKDIVYGYGRFSF